MEGSVSERIYSQRNHFLLFYRAKARVSTGNEVFCGNSRLNAEQKSETRASGRGLSLAIR